MNVTSDIPELAQFLGKYKKGNVEFRDFLFTHCKPSYHKLWQHILNCKGRYEETKEDNKIAYGLVFGKNTEYDQGIMRKFLKDFRKILFFFIQCKELDTTVNGSRVSASIFLKNGDYDQAAVVNEKALNLANEETESNQHYISWAVHFDQYFYPESETSRSKKEKITEQEVQEMEKQTLFKCEEELDNFYFINKLKLTIEKLKLWRGLGEDVDEKFKEYINCLFEMLPDAKKPLMVVQLIAIACFLKPRRKQYEEFKEAYFEKLDFLRSEKEYLLITLVNAMAIMPNVDDESRKEYLFLYKFGLEHNLLAENNNIPSQRFYNIIFITSFL